MKVAIGSDHAGLAFAAMARAVVEALGHEHVDYVPAPGERVDYPDHAARVAHDIAAGRADLGILVCGTGIGMSIAANKVRGVRAALCHGEFEAQMAREHNDANVLCLGERVIGAGVAEGCMRTFLTAAFAGGRHAARVTKLHDLEKP